MSSTLSAAGLGQSTAVSIGGDAIIGSTYAELMPLFEADEQTEGIVIYTEPGGRMEAELARWVTENDSRLPIVAFMAGRFMDEMPGMSFGHAGTIVEGKEDTASEKIARLAEAGITVAEEISQIPEIMKAKLDREERSGMRADAIFIGVEVDDAVAHDTAVAAKLAEVCPVDIYAVEGGHTVLVEENLDECVLCGLCLDAAPAGAVQRAQALRRGRRAAALREQPAHGSGAPALAPPGRLLRMPELPEAERARTTIERGALLRRIVDVDDGDSYVCRPHAPGEIADALVGRELTAAHRRGKAMWVETSGDGPVLGLHLGMAGRIAIDEEPAPRGWDRFVVHFEDGGRLALRDKRRLGRARLEPDLAAAGARRRRDLARRLPRARGARHRAAQGAPHGPGRRVGRGQPAGRRDPVARAPGSAPPGRRAEHRGARPPAPRGARRDALGDPPRRRPHRRRDRRAPARRPVPALRDRDAARHGRRPDDLLVPGGAALMIRSRPVVRMTGQGGLACSDCGR